VGLTVRDLDASLRFYRDLLELELEFRRDHVSKPYAQSVVGLPGARWSAALLRAPDGGAVELIEYHSPPGVPRVSTPNDAGTVHVAFEVAAIERISRRLEAAGVPFFSEPQEAPGGSSKGMKFVYCRDPDGVIVELLQPASA
jgi:catechol 2,3-dioxygenase-like lactoylglutathione lyase family enzyme